MHAQFDYPTRASLRKMTNQDAYAIQLYLAELEFPRIFSIELGYALFKVRRLGLGVCGPFVSYPFLLFLLYYPLISLRTRSRPTAKLTSGHIP
jgi:hypothetical protein